MTLLTTSTVHWRGPSERTCTHQPSTSTCRQPRRPTRKPGPGQQRAPLHLSPGGLRSSQPLAGGTGLSAPAFKRSTYSLKSHRVKATIPRQQALGRSLVCPCAITPVTAQISTPLSPNPQECPGFSCWSPWQLTQTESDPESSGLLWPHQKGEVRDRPQEDAWWAFKMGNERKAHFHLTFSTSALVTLMSASIFSKYCCARSASLQSRSNRLLLCRQKGGRGT